MTPESFLQLLSEVRELARSRIAEPGDRIGAAEFRDLVTELDELEERVRLDDIPNAPRKLGLRATYMIIDHWPWEDPVTVGVTNLMGAYEALPDVRRRDPFRR